MRVVCSPAGCDVTCGVEQTTEAPGLAVISTDEANVTVVLFMRDSVRDRWRRRAASARDYRNQQRLRLRSPAAVGEHDRNLRGR